MASVRSATEAVLTLMGNASSAKKRGVKDSKVIALANSSGLFYELVS